MSFGRSSRTGNGLDQPSTAGPGGEAAATTLTKEKWLRPARALEEIYQRKSEREREKERERE